MNTCEHDEFFSTVEIVRVREEDDGPVTNWHALVAIHCTECGQRFEFLGLPGGLDYDEATYGVSDVGEPEARLPIRPSLATVVN